MWSFCLSHFASKVIGVDRKPSCIERANMINSFLRNEKVKFTLGDVNTLSNLCKIHKPSGLFVQKTLGAALKDHKNIPIFKDACLGFDVVVSDSDHFSYAWKQPKEKVHNLLVFIEKDEF